MIMVMMRMAMVMMMTLIMMVITDPRMMIFPDQGWSCEFSLEKSGTRIRAEGSRNAPHEETQNAIRVSGAHLDFRQKL